MKHPLVTVRNLWVRLGDRPILKGLNCDVLRHEITALVGLNGAGKSTLLRALVKEVDCTGEIRFHCGHDHTRPSPEHVGYVPQKLRVEANLPLTVYDLFGLALQRRPLFLGVGKRVRLLMKDLLQRVRANPNLLDTPVEKISGGELQRVLLALALEPNPELLLLDEPAAGIDFKDQQPFYDLLSELNAKTGVTILLVSHDLSVVSRLAHQILCLEDGQIRCQGPPQDILTGDVLARTFGTDKAVFLHDHHHHHEAQPPISARCQVRESASKLNRVGPAHVEDKDLAVAHASGAGNAHDVIADFLHSVVGHADRDFHLRQKRFAIFAADVSIEIALLPAIPFRLAHDARRHIEPQIGQRAQDRLRSEWFDDDGELFHGVGPWRHVFNMPERDRYIGDGHIEIEANPKRTTASARWKRGATTLRGCLLSPARRFSWTRLLFYLARVERGTLGKRARIEP